MLVGDVLGVGSSGVVVHARTVEAVQMVMVVASTERAVRLRTWFDLFQGFCVAGFGDKRGSDVDSAVDDVLG